MSWTGLVVLSSPGVLILLVSPRYQSTLRTLLRGRIGAPGLGSVGQQRGARLQVGWAVVLRQACRPIPEPALGLGPSVEAKSSGRVSSGCFLVGRQWVTFEHRYQTVLESSQEIQHCPVRCPQRPRCASARGQGQTSGVHPWVGRVQMEVGEDPCDPCVGRPP